MLAATQPTAPFILSADCRPYEERHKDIRMKACGVVPMFRRVHVSTEFAFLVSGVFIMIVAWALNLIGVVSGDQRAPFGS